MKLRVLFYCVLVLSAVSNNRPFAQNASASAPEGPEFPQTWLEGTIGQSATVCVFLEPAGYPKEGGLWGMYYYTRYWSPIPLEGERLSSDTVLLYEGDPSGNPPSRPRFDLNVSEAAVVTGTWTSGDGRRTLPVRLRRIVRPAAYEADIQKPSLFFDTHWPIEFDFPAGWFLDIAGTKLVMRSPDPADMLFNNVLECERGRGLPGVPVVEGAVVHFQGRYYRASDGWRVETGPGPGANCESRDCEAPTTRQAGSAVLMSADIDYRHHGPWGYAGIGHAKEHLVIDGSEWVHCFDRLLDSEDRIRARPATGRTPERTEEESLTYKSDKCGYQFHVPPGWKVIEGDACSVEIVPVTMTGDGYDGTMLWLDPHPLEQAAKGAGFIREDGEWSVLGRQGLRSSAQEIRSAGWTGVTGSALVGTFDEQGYAGLVEENRAVLNDFANRSVTISSDGYLIDVFDTVMRTFKFVALDNRQ